MPASPAASCGRDGVPAQPPCNLPQTPHLSGFCLLVGGIEMQDHPGSHMWKMMEPASARVPMRRGTDSPQPGHTEDLTSTQGDLEVFSGSFLQPLDCMLCPVHWCTLVGARRVGRRRFSSTLQGRWGAHHCACPHLPLLTNGAHSAPRGQPLRPSPVLPSGPCPQPPGCMRFVVRSVSLRGTLLRPADFAEDILVCEIVCSPLYW